MRRRKSFVPLYERMRKDIRATARNQTIISMTTEEVEAEMVECLWKAHRTYNENSGLTIEQYWWAIWMNKKADLLKFLLAAKRDERLKSCVDMALFWQEDHELAHAFTLPHPVLEDHLFPACPSSDPVHVRIWALLAHGATRSEVLQQADISKKTYYTIVKSWADDSTREMLEH